MNQLIILTQEFPFGKGENFLAEELHTYSEAGVPVLLVPYKSFGEQRELPKGVTVFLSSSARLSWLHNTFYLCGKAWFWKEIFEHGSILLQRESRTSFLFFIKMTLRTKRAIEQIENQQKLSTIDVLYSYWFTGLTGGAILFNEKKKDKIFIVSRAHGGDVYEDRHKPPYLPFRKFLLKGVNYVAVVSNDGANYIKSLYPQYQSLIHVHYLGTSHPNFVALPSTDDEIRIVSCAYVTPVKRMPLLVDSLKAFSSQCPERKIHWTHLGGGPLWSELKQYADEQLKETTIGWQLAGDLSPNAVTDFYRLNPVDLFVSVSSSEGLPVSMMEAMSVGVPVLSTDVGGVKELVEMPMLMPVDSNAEQIAISIFKCLNRLTTETRADSINKWRMSFDSKKNYIKFITDVNLARARG